MKNSNHFHFSGSRDLPEYGLDDAYEKNERIGRNYVGSVYGKR
ncbi:MAG: hypothetical protein ABIH83_03970 [Candidatus Micrarchaeota archaeon]